MNKNKSGTMYIFWSVAIVACLLLVLFALLFSSCSKGGEAKASPSPTQPAVTESATPAPDPAATPPASVPPSAPPAASAYELGETADAGQEYIDKLTFLGDSTTHGLAAYGVLSGREDTTQVWTPASGTLTLSNQSFATIVYPETKDEITIVEAVKRKLPEYLVITLGVNGVSFMDETYFTDEYTKLVKSVQEASPDTKIILNSIYPVENDYENIEYINNTNITAANGWIRKIAEATGVKFTNSAPVLTAADGSLVEDYGNGDGIHLNATGYMKVLEYLRTHAYQ
ncbi:MAG: GDSL-type esterase/lipase family protein [Oscillospiraceae bacterium]